MILSRITQLLCQNGKRGMPRIRPKEDGLLAASTVILTKLNKKCQLSNPLLSSFFSMDPHVQDLHSNYKSVKYLRNIITPISKNVSEHNDPVFLVLNSKVKTWLASQRKKEKTYATIPKGGTTSEDLDEEGYFSRLAKALKERFGIEEEPKLGSHEEPANVPVQDQDTKKPEN